MSACLPGVLLLLSIESILELLGAGGGAAVTAWHVAVSPKRAENTELSGRGLSREQGPSNALAPILALGSIADQLWGHVGAWSGHGAAFRLYHL